MPRGNQGNTLSFDVFPCKFEPMTTRTIYREPDAKPKEVAERLGLHVETVRQITREGAFPNAYKTGRGCHSSPVRIPWQDVEDYRRKQPRASR